MKILIVYPGSLAVLRRGTPIRTMNIARHLCSMHHVMILTKEVSKESMVPYQLLPKSIRGFHWLRHCITLFVVLHSFQPDLVYGHTHRSLFLTYVARILGYCTCIDIHGWWEQETILPFLQKKFIGLIYRFMMSKMHCWTGACSLLRHVYRLPVTRFHTLHGGIDLPWMASLEPERLPVDDPVIAYCGNLRSYQGVDLLMKALQEMSQISWHFLFVCSSDLEQAQRMVSEAGIADRTTVFTNLPQQRVFQLLKGAMISVVPRPDIALTRYAFPSKLIEYLASGSAVICTAVGDATSVMTNGNVGWLVSPGNVSALRTALCQAIDDPARCKEHARQAHALVQREYAWSVLIAKLNDFLHNFVHES